MRFIFTFLCIISLMREVSPQGLLSDNDKIIIDSLFNGALRQRTAYEWLKDICINIGPRLSGSDASNKSLDWAVNKLNGMSNVKVYRQELMVPYWERGKVEKAYLISNGNQTELKVAALGGSIGTGSSLLASQVIELKSFEELEQRKAEVKNKIVFFNNEFPKTVLNTFEVYGQLARYRVFGAREAAKFGAVAVIVRSITSSEDNVPHVGVMIYNDTIPKIPAVAIGVLDAGVLHNSIVKDKEALVSIQLSCQILPDRPSANIIAEIKGTEKPEEVIVVSGHFDSWDKGQGAHDDGAGCVQSMEVIKLFSDMNYKPLHTIRCVLFMNEENGSRGSAKYTELSTEKHLAAIESDRGGFLPNGFSFDGDSLLFEKLREFIPQLNRWGVWYFQKGGSGADIGRIKDCKMKLGYVPDSQRYFEVHHSDNDVIGAVNPRELELGSAVNAMMVYILDKYF